MNYGINALILKSFFISIYIFRIEEGLRMLFVPVHNGIYVPLITGKDDGKKMNKNENFLDLECLDLKSKDYLKYLLSFNNIEIVI